MTTVLAAIDESATSTPILRAGRSFATILSATLQAIHVREPGQDVPHALSDLEGVPLRVIDGDPGQELVRATASADVELVVVGARGASTGPRPAGHIALAVVSRVDKPVLVVPPQAQLHPNGAPIRRALIPLEGTAESSTAVAAALSRLTEAGVELIGLHVFDPVTVPRFWGEPGHTEQGYAAEFLSRWCENRELHLALRRGSAPESVIEAAEAEEVDLIALGWSQDLTPGRAAVVRTTLARARVPVLLVPVEAHVTSRGMAPRPG